MIIVGLTGNIASGKSVVAHLLKKWGAQVIDMDAIAKDIQSRNVNNVVDKIRETFGKDVTKDNKLIRKKLAEIVFYDKNELGKLNKIMIPLMTDALKKIINEKRKQRVKILVVDAAILFEAKWDRLVDTVWVVYAPMELQIERLTKRERIKRDEALKRIESQMDIKEKIKKADAVIDNSGSFVQMEEQTRKLWEKMQNSI